MPPYLSVSKSILLTICLITSCFLYLANSSVQTVDPSGVGTDLYFAEAITKGQIPYRDFNDNYGPLMNYFNALLVKVFGYDIHSLIGGKVALKTISSGIFFLAAIKIMPPLFALAASLAFTVFTPDFSHNIKSYAIICIETGNAWVILSYLASVEKKYILWGALFITLSGLIKINFGIVLLGATFISFFLIDLFKHKKPPVEAFLNYCFLATSIFALWILIYYLHLKGLTLNEIQQCLPFLNNYSYHEGSVYNGFIDSIKTYVAGNSRDFFQLTLKFILCLAVIRLITRMCTHFSCTVRLTSLHRNYALITAALLICFIASNNEFYIGRADYESFYSRPFAVMIIAYIVSEASLISGLFIQWALFSFFSIFIIINACSNWESLRVYEDPSHFFKYKGINVHVTNDPRDMETMIQTADYIKNNSLPDDKFFAFPYHGVYYFLLGRLSPSRLISLVHVERISPAQEINLINELETKKNRFIILDNICYFGKAYDDYGVFGQNNCLLLDRYMKKYYKKVAEFGAVPSAHVGTEIFEKIF